MHFAGRANLVCAALLLGLACNKGDSSDTAGKNVKLSIDELSASLGVTLPPDTRIVGVYGEAGVDDTRSAKLEIPKQRMSGFLAATRIPRFEKTDADLLGPDRGFGTPTKLQVFSQAMCSCPALVFYSLHTTTAVPTSQSST